MRNTAPRRISPVNQRNSYVYMRGSAAPDFPQEEYPRKKSKRQKDTAVQRVQVVENYIRVNERKNVLTLGNLLLGFGLLTVFAFCIMLLTINARISSVKSEIKANQILTEKTERVNERLKIMMTENTDMEQIKQIATTRLGMQTAAPHQIVNIHVEKDSYAIQYEDKVAEKKNRSFLERIGITGKEDQ